MKRVISLQDLSCFGKCSLTLALPVISAMGVECVPVPTAILSTHTGNLGEVTVVDMTDSILPMISHIKRLGIAFDVIYIGYLGSNRQIDIAKALIDMFRTEDTKMLLDPVMGDNGALYKRFNSSYIREMSSLIPFADYVVPNLTEAAFLSKVEYSGEQVNEEYLREVFSSLQAGYSSRFVITGVCNENGEIGAVSYHAKENNDIVYMTKRTASHYHGAGDIFASVMAGSLANRLSLKDSIIKSVDFTAAVIENTVKVKTVKEYGLHFEDCLSLLTN